MSFDKIIPILIFTVSFSINLYSLPPKIWGSIEYLHFWASNSPISVPLITANNNPLAFGIINEPGTRIIFGAGSPNDAFNFGGLNGGRLTIAGWLDDGCRYGLEGSLFGLAKKESSFTASSVGGEILVINIPFFSTQSASEDVLVDKLPNTATVRDSFQPFGLELNGLIHVSQTPLPLIGIVGLRHFNIHEHLTLNDEIYNNPSTPNQVLNVEDNFGTKNNFYGFQLGARMDFDYSNFNVELSTKIALGQTQEELKISGQTNVDNLKIIQTIGLFAEPTNIGCFKNNPFAVLPEITAKLRYHINCHLSSILTYNGLYINKIIRPGSEIDRNINTSQNPLLGGSGILSGAAAPLAQFNQRNLWLQGLSLGVEFRY